MLQRAETERTYFPESGVAMETPAALVTEVLDEAMRYCEELGRFTALTAGFFRSCDENQALDHLIDLITGIDWLTKAFGASVTALGLDFGAVLTGGTTLRQDVESLNTLLGQIVHAQERKDWVLLTDLLEYELSPLLAEWRGMFGVMKGAAQAPLS